MTDRLDTDHARRLADEIESLSPDPELSAPEAASLIRTLADAVDAATLEASVAAQALPYIFTRRLRQIVADVEAKYPGLREHDPLSDWNWGVVYMLDRLTNLADAVDAARPAATPGSGDVAAVDQMARAMAAEFDISAPEALVLYRHDVPTHGIALHDLAWAALSASRAGQRVEDPSGGTPSTGATTTTVDTDTLRALRAAVAWVNRAHQGSPPNMWADREDFALIEAVDALPAHVRAALDGDTPGGDT